MIRRPINRCRSSENRSRPIRKLGVSLSFVPEDRLGMGLVGSMGMTENMMLKSYTDGFPFFTDKRPPKKLAEKIMEDLEVVTPGRFDSGSQAFRRQRTKGACRP